MASLGRKHSGSCGSYLGPFHHRRRSLSDADKEREDRQEALPPPWDSESRWYGKDFPPRPGNALHVLPHGDQYFTDLCRELRRAERRVTIAGWSLTPLMEIERAPPR